MGAAPNPDLFATLLLAALWLVGWDLAAWWWNGDTIGWPTLWEAGSAAGLAVLAMLE